ncbi:peptidyl-prolyl cis-trans isomerase A (cyclophilin A) [Luteibacter rhizovicinus]|uniref:Peptidyl-prolyl cis-trans isomerase n=1 Tax=Luteibacter rhizovicinus TaxID=242606 RepID=A0A4R3YTH3_9GAMM|nr:peptidylprolyl isomerase [Luteibacter rhizovicinus]TCV94624.1 peptidyl-prolyl cis-trans isomerase A (cyclophilin A) [Luteibacter rhizovicinus]
MLRYALASLLLALPLSLAAQTAKPNAPTAGADQHPRVVMHTSQGDVTLELYPEKAPKSVANFTQYVRDGFYDGTVFHRVVDGYMIQGGLYGRDLTQRRTRAAIPSEADNGLSNLRGTIAVARGADPNSGTAQFYINLVDNRRLDYVSNQSGLTWGFAVFGKVVTGMDVVDKIAKLPTHPQGPFVSDVPDPLVVITTANVVGEEKATPAPTASAPPAPPAPKSDATKSAPAKAKPAKH